MANNKHLNRYDIEPKNQAVNEFVFEDLIVEETDLENPELDEIQQKARKALGREEAEEEGNFFLNVPENQAEASPSQNENVSCNEGFSRLVDRFESVIEDIEAEDNGSFISNKRYRIYEDKIKPNHSVHQHAQNEYFSANPEGNKAETERNSEEEHEISMQLLASKIEKKKHELL